MGLCLNWLRGKGLQFLGCLGDANKIVKIEAKTSGAYSKLMKYVSTKYIRDSAGIVAAVEISSWTSCFGTRKAVASFSGIAACLVLHHGSIIQNMVCLSSSSIIAEWKQETYLMERPLANQVACC